YAVPSLEALVQAGHELVGVVSQPDRRRGRGRGLMPSAVKARALELGLPVFTPTRIRREPEMQAALAALRPDLSVVVAFGQILPPEVLAVPPLGCWNGHGSLLPRWRGAAPIQWALMEGDPCTGVGIMAMEEGLDTGPVLLESRLAIGLLEAAPELSARLSALTARLLVEALPRIAAAGPGPERERLARLGVTLQPEEGMTYARQLSREDFRLDWNQSGLALHRRVMGLHPGAHTSWRGLRLQILRSEPLVRRLAGQLSPEGAHLAGRWGLAPERSERQDFAPLGDDTAAAAGGAPDDVPLEAPGTVLAIVPSVGLVVATGGCPLLVRQARLEGKTAVEGTALIQQWGGTVGDRFGLDGGHGASGST
ncbi:MAG: methionyl-tRNA formyltransferase, partial [Cyanobium sp.]